MALGNVIAPPKIIGKGANSLGGMYPAYVSGSGNYISFFVACDYDTSITSCAISNVSTGNINAYTVSGSVTAFDFTYCGVSKKENGLKIELKFTTTRTEKAVVALVDIVDAVTFTFS